MVVLEMVVIYRIPLYTGGRKDRLDCIAKSKVRYIYSAKYGNLSRCILKKQGVCYRQCDFPYHHHICAWYDEHNGTTFVTVSGMECSELFVHQINI